MRRGWRDLAASAAAHAVIMMAAVASAVTMASATPSPAAASASTLPPAADATSAPVPPPGAVSAPAQTPGVPSSPAQAPGPVPAPAALLRLAPEGEPGTRLTLDVTVRAADGTAVPGAEVHVYQTDAEGRYTPERAMDEPHARLQGRVKADGQGRFRLLTIHPGGYPKALRLGDADRKIPAHIHMDITAPGHTERRLQVVFAADPLLADPYWVDWVRRLGQPVLTTRPEGDGQAGDLSITLP